MKLSYTVKEVRPRIFLLSFSNNYDLCMFFVRYQEFYECPSSKFRDKQFNLLDYMSWYAKTKGQGVFSYPKDWSGFNLPSYTIKKVWDLGITDRNIYDYEMLMLYQKFLEQYPDNKFYIIGACEGATQTMKHEIAHGLFFTQTEYKEEMSAFVKNLKRPFFKSMCKTLKEWDTLQKFMSMNVKPIFPLVWLQLLQSSLKKNAIHSSNYMMNGIIRNESF